MSKTLWIERLFPLAATLFVFGVAFYFRIPDFVEINKSTMGPLISSSITFASISIGFIATSMAIMASIHNSDLMKKLHSSTYINDLIHYMIEAIVSSSCFLLICFAFYFKKNVGLTYQVSWCFFGSYSLFALIRIITIISLILKRLK